MLNRYCFNYFLIGSSDARTPLEYIGVTLFLPLIRMTQTNLPDALPLWGFSEGGKCRSASIPQPV